MAKQGTRSGQGLGPCKRADNTDKQDSKAGQGGAVKQTDKVFTRTTLGPQQRSGQGLDKPRTSRKRKARGAATAIMVKVNYPFLSETA